MAWTAANLTQHQVRAARGHVVNVPTSLASIDAAWLTAALAEAGHAAPPVAALDYQPIAGNVGALGEVGVFTVAYEGDTDLPVQFLGKCPLDNDSARLYNSIMRYYGRESGFCHGTVVGTYLTALLGHDDPFVLLPDYCGIYRVTASSGGLRTLRSANETAHVQAHPLP